MARPSLPLVAFVILLGLNASLAAIPYKSPCSEQGLDTYDDMSEEGRLRACTKDIEQNPNDPSFREHRANFLRHVGRLKEAEADLRAAIEVNDQFTSFDTDYMLEWRLGFRRRVRSTLVAIDPLALGPDADATACLTSGEEDTAPDDQARYAACSRLIERDPKSADAYFGRFEVSRSYEPSRLTDKAKALRLEKAFAEARAKPDFDSLCSTGNRDPHAAIDACTRIIEEQGASQERVWDALFQRGLRKRKAGDLDGALADLEESFADRTWSSSYDYEHGLTLEAKGDLKGAEADLARAVRKAPDAMAKEMFQRDLDRVREALAVGDKKSQ